MQKRDTIKFAFRLAFALGLMLSNQAMPGLVHAQQPIPRHDDVFVSLNSFGISRVVRFSREAIADAINGVGPAPNSTFVADLTPTNAAEGMAVDVDGTFVISLRPRTNDLDRVVRLTRDGLQQGVVTLGRDNDGPAFDRYRRLYVNDNVRSDVATLQAPADTPPLGQTLGANAFTTQVDNDTHETMFNTVFLEDSKVGPPSLPSPLEGALFVAADSDPNGGTPRSVDAWSTLAPNTLAATEVLFDFAMNFNFGVPGNPLTVDEFRSLGMAFDSQGDLWVTRHLGRQGYELLEFRYDPVDARFEGERRIELRRPDNSPVPDQAMAKISIVAGRPHDPFTDFSGDTIFAVDTGRLQNPPLTGYVYPIVA